MPYAPFIFALFVIGIGHTVLLNGVIFKLKFSSINLLMTIAVVAAFIWENTRKQQLYLYSVLGERLEDIGLENSKSALDQLVNRAPKTAFVKLENKNIPVNKVTVGTIIQVKPGEMIPLDGKIISGETTVDEGHYRRTHPKRQASWCYFICRNTQQNGFIEMETTTLSIDTTFAKIIRLTLKQRHLEVTHRNSFSVSLNSILLA
jgi:Cd2+/Zn2+-exporting ATPase